MKGKLTEAGRDLVAKMGRAYEDCSAYNVNPKGMEAALRVAAEEMPPERRNALFAPLEPEDRVTVEHVYANAFGWKTFLDQDERGIFDNKEDAETFRLVLIQQIKEGKRP